MRYPVVAALVIVTFWAAKGGAQDKDAPPAPQQKATAAATPGAPAVPLKVTVVISRYQGDKKISSLPYVFGVASGDRTNLRMGSEVPITARATKSGDSGQPNFSYRGVGTNIDCIADRGATGTYKLNLAIEDTSVHLDPGQKPGSPALLNELPSFRTFKTSFAALLRDGQSTQYTSATDPVSGEVMKIDVTLNLMK